MININLSDVKNFIRNKINDFLGRDVWYKYYGKKNKINYPDLSIYELIEKTSKSFPNYDAYEYFGKTVSYKDFILKIKKSASALLEIGVKKVIE